MWSEESWQYASRMVVMMELSVSVSELNTASSMVNAFCCVDAVHVLVEAHRYT